MAADRIAPAETVETVAARIASHVTGKDAADMASEQFNREMDERLRVRVNGVLALPEAHGRRNLATFLAVETDRPIVEIAKSLAKAPTDEAQIAADRIMAQHCELRGYKPQNDRTI
jgi:hypothetical protein